MCVCVCVRGWNSVIYKGIYIVQERQRGPGLQFDYTGTEHVSLLILIKKLNSCNMPFSNLLVIS